MIVVVDEVAVDLCVGTLRVLVDGGDPGRPVQRLRGGLGDVTWTGVGLMLAK